MMSTDKHESAYGPAATATATIGKRAVIRLLARRMKTTISVTEEFYDAVWDTILEAVRSGAQVNLTGFGKFYRQHHRGHIAPFSKQGHTGIDAYSVLKFSATRQSSQFVGMIDDVNAEPGDPGAELPSQQRRKPTADRRLTDVGH